MLAAEKKHAIANLARGVSHDVNNALGSVLPLVQQMLSDVRSGSVDLQILAEDLQQIEQSLQTCCRIFGGMLAFARGAGQRVLEANVHRALESTFAILKDSMERQGVGLNLNVPEEVPLVKGGQGDLEQLLLNLAANARDSMPTGGLLSVEARRVGEMVEIAINDTGCGIPSEQMARIEEPFFTTKHNGSGLGLSICRSILWDMHGDLKIKSQPGSGTQARVLLPMLEGTHNGVQM